MGLNKSIVHYFILLVILSISCKSEEPEISITVNTFNPLSVGSTVTTIGGEIVVEGNPAIISKGICYGTTSNPTITDVNVTSTQTGNTFSVNLSGLLQNTSYYARAFATSDAGVVYGNEITFNTGLEGSYVGGYNAAGKATLWRDGVPSDLWGTVSEASSIVVYGRDIYLIGKVYNSDKNIYSFVYWKNGSPTNVVDLNSSTINSRLGGLAISGNDVHIVWTEVNTVTKIGTIKYWKNGNYISLTDGVNDAEANSIVVSGKDVYIAGSEVIGGFSFAVVWKNGLPVPLTVGKTNAMASAVFVYNNDVYVAGSEVSSADATKTITIARYWINGAPTSLSDGTKKASAESIFVNSSGIYVAGIEQNASGIAVAKYWKNGVTNLLTDGSNASSASQIVVSDDDVYVVGKDGTMGTIWKNGTKLSPFDTNDPSVAPLCISVIK